MDATIDIEARRQEAEREVRRGNFQAAIRIYEGLVDEAPEDERLGPRLDTLRTLLQPLELTSPKAAAGARPATSAENDAQAGEAAANRGALAEAVAAYERACAAAPGNALLAERLEELRTAARARGIPLGAPAPTAAASGDGKASGARRPAASSGPTGAAPASPSGAVPAPPRTAAPAPPLPADPVARLEALLDRVQRRRRPRSGP